ncbi:MAG: Tll0287-like domain-containing protein [Verrucomicrobiia bacterium]
MKAPSLISAFFLFGLVLAAGWSAAESQEKAHKLRSVSLKKFADSLHAVIAADRQAYAELIVQRLASDQKRIAASENWQSEQCLPVHAQMLRHAARGIQQKGAEFSYTLRSLWPINNSHGPQTMVEQQGLEAVARKPNEPFYAEEELGGRSYFTAVYADFATLPSCAECHNSHSSSPKTDFKVGDVMGGIIVRIPLEF